MSSSRTDCRFAGTRAFSAAFSALILAACVVPARAASVDPRVTAAAARDGSADVLLVFADQSTPALPLRRAASPRVRRRALVEALSARAANDQQALRAWLGTRAVAQRSYWIANVIQARVPRAMLDELAARPDLAAIESNSRVVVPLPRRELAGPAAAAGGLASGIAWGVARIEAPLVWGSGYIGQGVVIGGEDTGYQWDHPALKTHYRGWNGSVAVHDYNWHDAIHDSSGNPCGNDSPQPCDDYGHGTHTAGTFAGNDDAGNATGVAPGAKWIGCRNMDVGAGTPARYIECMQWMLAPTDLADANPNPDLGADIVSNSWNCPASEGCTPSTVLEPTVANLVAGGVFFAVSAGNSGPACATIVDPPPTYDESFVVGATDSADALASFSSRGPVAGSALVRPDLSAPGKLVYSSWPPNTYATLSGTSMAAPHVAGAAALLMSAYPALKGHPARVAQILRATAVTSGVTNTAGVVQSCGTTPITQWPNYMAGYGRLDAWNAYHEVIFIDDFDG